MGCELMNPRRLVWGCVSKNLKNSWERRFESWNLMSNLEPCELRNPRCLLKNPKNSLEQRFELRNLMNNPEPVRESMNQWYLNPN